ncbi:SAV_2336 N-terminal domain-related protein [Streptomyces sp. NPDC093111]|uniref:SAV_2336 N-terminal domain-related protein n=1 Tax=Streptomyces sp. NPDC093111 TaxID=3154978 RepID=UPI003448AE54
MTSDRAAGEALTALADLLAAAGQEPPTGRELAELLWLARQTGTPERPVERPEPRTPEPAPRVLRRSDPLRPALPAAPPGPEPAPGPAPRVPLHAPAAAPGPRSAPRPESRPEPAARPHSPLLAPAPPMLARPLALQRSLRPLRRTVPSAAGRELDETATADRIAALGAGRRAWLPVLRPRQERWLHLRIVLDTGPTMTMWRPLARELHTALAQTGAFRTLDVLRLGEDGRLPRRHRERGRTAVLVVSDAMGPQWHEGPAGVRWRGTLAALAGEAPVALLQPLPERLWRHTAAPAVPGRFVSPAAGVPNAALEFAPYDGVPGRAGVPLPVLEPTDVWLGHWAELVASPSGAEVPGAAAFVTPRGPVAPDDALVPEDTDPEELVLRFRALASPQAFRLAAHLAVGSARLPVMRLVQAAVERRPEPQHLAEVVLSGMLRAHPGADPGAYAFRPGVREVLLGALPRTSLIRTAELLARVSAEIDARAGALPGEFRALVESLEGRGADRAVGRPFALVSEESVRLLRGPERVPPGSAGSLAASAAGSVEPDARAERRSTPEPDDAAPEPDAARSRLLAGRYELLELRPGPAGEELWTAHDHGHDRRVLVRVHPFAPPPGFAARVEALRAAGHPHLVRVLAGFETGGRCAVVLQGLSGRTLRDVLAGAPGGLTSFRALFGAGELAAALLALHDAGFVHGAVRPDRVLMDEQEKPVLGEPSLVPEQRPEDDLYDLGRLLYEMATGQAPPDDGDDLPSPRQVQPDVPLSLDQSVLGLLSDHTAHRRDAVLRLAGLVRGLGSRPWGAVPRPNYRVLGPVKAWFDPLPERDALVLAPLLLAGGRFVEVETLPFETAGEPAHIADVMARLELLKANGHPVETRSSSARIDLTEVRFDLATAERLAERAAEAARSGDHVTGALLYRAALALWRSEPLAGLPGRWASRERRRLTSLRARWQEQLAALSEGAQARGARLLAVASGADAGGSAIREFASVLRVLGLEGVGSTPMTHVTDLPPEVAVRLAADAALSDWRKPGPRRPVVLRVAVSGETADVRDLADVILAQAEQAGAAAERGPLLLLGYPRWIHDALPERLRTGARWGPGPQGWLWLKVVPPREEEAVTSVPQPSVPVPWPQEPAPERPRGFLARLFRRRPPP